MRRPVEDTSGNNFIQALLEAENIAIGAILLIVVILAAYTFLF